MCSSLFTPRDRHMLLALQRPGEIDQTLIKKLGPSWHVRTRHIPDRCDPPGDDIGLTGMAFWPKRTAAPAPADT